jgi:hypothetical protein
MKTISNDVLGRKNLGLLSTRRLTIRMSNVHLVCFKLYLLLSDTPLLHGRKLRCGRSWMHVWSLRMSGSIQYLILNRITGKVLLRMLITGCRLHWLPSLPGVKKSKMQILINNCKTIGCSIFGHSNKTSIFIICQLFIWIKTTFII